MCNAPKPGIVRIHIAFQHTGEEVSGEELHEMLREIDTNMNGQVELDEYLQVNDSQLSLTFWHTNLLAN
jgi:Ca2+-binding EF-hand superfamily protein